LWLLEARVSFDSRRVSSRASGPRGKARHRMYLLNRNTDRKQKTQPPKKARGGQVLANFGDRRSHSEWGKHHGMRKRGDRCAQRRRSRRRSVQNEIKRSNSRGQNQKAKQRVLSSLCNRRWASLWRGIGRERGVKSLLGQILSQSTFDVGIWRRSTGRTPTAFCALGIKQVGKVAIEVPPTHEETSRPEGRSTQSQ